MRNIFVTVIFLIFNSIFLASNSYADSPKKNSCDLIHALVEKGADGGNKQMEKMANWMPSSTRSQLSSIFSTFKNLDAIAGDVFLVTNIPDYVEEHLVIIKSKKEQNLYMRIHYEYLRGEMRLFHFDIDSPFIKSISKRRFAQSPELWDCG